MATALVGDPVLMFLDEPTTGLDPHSRRQLAEIILDCRRHGRTTLLTTHYMEEAERLCDRVAIVDHGLIIALGSPRELIARLGGEHVVEFSVQSPEAVQLPAESWSGLPAVTGCRYEDGLDPPFGDRAARRPSRPAGVAGGAPMAPGEPDHPPGEPRRRVHQPDRAAVRSRAEVDNR